MIVLAPPLVRDFLEQHQMLKREIVCIIDNQEFRAVLVQVSHEFGLARAPMPSDRQAKRPQKLVAPSLLIGIVFWSHHRETGSPASPFFPGTDTHGLARRPVSRDA